MNRHPYLRAYMAGIVVPTLFMLIVLTFFSIVRFTHHVQIPLERLLIFPMTLIPNAWGAWNMLYVWLHSRRPIPIGLYGAAFLVLWMPAAFFLQKALDIMIWTPAFFAIGFPIGLVIYYLAWKHAVGFLNELLGIA